MTFFSRFPPPTEKTNTMSPAFSRLPLSHSTKTLAHPSSFVRAVSSDTLSVGVYASIPAILRKSFTAWEQFAALPPTPRKKSRPPPLAQADQKIRHSLNRLDIKGRQRPYRLVDVPFCVTHRCVSFPDKYFRISSSPSGDPIS